MNNKFWLLCLLLVAMLQASAQNTFKVEAGAVIKTTGGVIITLQDMNLDNDGTINQAAGEGTFRFTGTGNNTISGTSVSLFDIMEIAKTGAAKISLQQNLNIGSAVNFTTGQIDLNGNNILLQPTAFLNGESELSRIIGTTGGYVEITNALNAPAAANPGNFGAIFTSAANLGNTIIRRGHQSQTNGSGLGSSVLRYYDITPANNSGLNASLRFQYFDAELNGLTEAVLTLWKSNNTSSWTDEGFSTRNLSTNFVEKIGIADFSRWTLSTPGNPLPVTYILFNTKCNDDKTELNWRTTFEQNSNYFEIQRSADAVTWQTIGSTPAAGYSATEKSYYFSDIHPLSSTAFYRIAEIGMDSRIHYTGIIKNNCGQAGKIQFWPNPVIDLFHININTAKKSTAIINIYNSKGSLVGKQQNILLAGNNNVVVDMSNFPNGIYPITVSWNDGQMQETIKAIKQ